MSHKLRLPLVFLLNEDVSPDLFAVRVAETCQALRLGEGIELPSDPSKTVLAAPRSPGYIPVIKPKEPLHYQLGRAFVDAVIEFERARKRLVEAGGHTTGGWRHTKLYKELVKSPEWDMHHAKRDLIDMIRQLLGSPRS